MQVLYQPRPGFHPGSDNVRAILSDRFDVTDAATSDDALSLLQLQGRHQSYHFDAFVIGTDPTVSPIPIFGYRAACPLIPIILLTTERRVSAVKAQYLTLGADDCLPVRHVHAEELIAVILRRIGMRAAMASCKKQVGNVALDMHYRDVAIADTPCRLSASQYVVLEKLVMRYPHRARVSELFQNVDPCFEGDERELLASLEPILTQLRSLLRDRDASVGISRLELDGHQLFLR